MDDSSAVWIKMPDDFLDGLRHAADEDDAAGNSLQADYMRKAANEIERLRSALVPFANAARTGVVQDALSFGRNAPRLTLTRGFGQTTLDPWDFAEALKLT